MGWQVRWDGVQTRLFHCFARYSEEEPEGSPSTLRDTLANDGHHITTANGGQAGLAAFVAAQQHGEPFTVVITDLGMPSMDGRQVAAAIKAAAPATPVLLLTGWGQRLADERDTPPHVDRVLSKPPRLRELRAALAELTAGAGQTKR